MNDILTDMEFAVIKELYHAWGREKELRERLNWKRNIGLFRVLMSEVQRKEYICRTLVTCDEDNKKTVLYSITTKGAEAAEYYKL